MQFLVSRCIDKLDLRNSKTLNPIKWWKKNKAYYPCAVGYTKIFARTADEDYLLYSVCHL